MSEQGPPAGWYPHPEMANTRRYWDGTAWTGDTAPATYAPVVIPKQGVDGLVIAGWICAFVFPIVGFFLGLAAYRTHKEHAVGIMGLSVIVTIAAVAALV